MNDELPPPTEKNQLLGNLLEMINQDRKQVVQLVFRDGKPIGKLVV